MCACVNVCVCVCLCVCVFWASRGGGAAMNPFSERQALEGPLLAIKQSRGTMPMCEPYKMEMTFFLNHAFTYLKVPLGYPKARLPVRAHLCGNESI